MKNYSWNNRRRSKSYWFSIILFFSVSLNIEEYFAIDKGSSIRVLLDGINEFYHKIIPVFIKSAGGTAQHMIFTLVTIYMIGLFFIWLLNIFFGLLPNARVSEKNLRYPFLLKTVVIQDIFLGFCLEIFAIKGLYDLRGIFRFTSISLWLYIVAIIFGSYLYWENTLLIREMYLINGKCQYEKDFEQYIWFCISNVDESFSTFSRVPWNGEVRHIFVDKKDLKCRDGINEDDFFYYLCIVDAQKPCEEEYVSEIRKITNRPHANAFVFQFGESNECNDLMEALEREKSVHIFKFPPYRNLDSIDIESIIDGIEYKNKKLKLHPNRFIENGILMDIYSKVHEGPQIGLDFLKMIMNSLDVLPSIYALFDYIDLQYRIQIAITLESDFDAQYTWMKKRGRVVGNINTMANMIENSVILETLNSTVTLLPSKVILDDIITEEDMVMINKYLPDYEREYERPIQDTIVYLTTSLRNVLRGHGTFENKDAMKLYTLVFKLALLNLYLLNGNAIYLSIDNTVIWKDGEYCYYRVVGEGKSNSPKVLSPFLVATQNGNILVFNNWIRVSNDGRNQIEYINYMDGTLILPQYRSIMTENDSN